MKSLQISPNFTIEDIHKIREANYHIVKDMTNHEKCEYYNERGIQVHHIIQEMKKNSDRK